MRSKISTLVILVLLFFTFCSSHNENKAEPGKNIPSKTGYLKVSDLHEIYYQVGGNPSGKTFMVLHGGPGAGCDTSNFRYFDLEKNHVILHDQRGAGESRPYAALEENTTQNLVEDIEKLRTHLGLGKVILFGGSWGSTLALAYAETYPQNVDGLILRGVFTSRQKEIDHFYHGGVADYFPEVYAKLKNVMDRPDEKTYPRQLLEKMKNEDKTVGDKYARAWANYEAKIAFLKISDERIRMILDSWPYFAFSIIENHYMANKCFLDEGQLLNNTDRIKHIKTFIINGRYDVICPPITAYELHQKLDNSELWIVEKAGHSSSEPGIKKALIKAVEEFE